MTTIAPHRGAALPRRLGLLTVLSADAWSAMAVLLSPRIRRLLGRRGREDELNQEMAALTWLLVAAGFAGQLRARRR
jgi:hypothetical protein